MAKKLICPACDGLGYFPSTTWLPAVGCRRCKGQGFIYPYQLRLWEQARELKLTKKQ